jgi:cytochrome c oxidase cbb3-type subunit III
MRPAFALLALAVCLGACDREDRDYRADPVPREPRDEIAQVSLSPGPAPPQVHKSGLGKQYESSAYHVAQGKKYYAWFNCNGCHANGGGDSGPALMDDKWIYGSEIENIVQTIREGRPNGMPSFRGKITDEQIWQLAAYVRSMGRYVSKDVAPGRNDDMQARPAESSLPPGKPTPGGNVPPSGQMPQ